MPRRGIPALTYPWLLGLLACPHDGGQLEEAEGGVRCSECARVYPVERDVLELLPDHLADFGISERARSAGGGGEETERDWLEGEMKWWKPWYERDSGRPANPRAGLRGRSRERNLLRHMRPRLGTSPVLAEMGAGSSRSIAGLWAPGEGGPRYVATDLSRPGLDASAVRWGPGAAAVQCDAAHWPFKPASLDAVLIFGVLHHLPDWRGSLRQACESVRPGGFLALHEVIEKPRIFAKRRASGVNDAWTSPHEGHVSASELRAALEAHGRIARWRGEASPLRFALVHYLDLHERLEANRPLTIALDVADQAFGRTLGVLRPSLGFAEATVLLERS